jgi:hypothetical protein
MSIGHVTGFPDTQEMPDTQNHPNAKRIVLRRHVHNCVHKAANNECSSTLPTRIFRNAAR